MNKGADFKIVSERQYSLNKTFKKADIVYQYSSFIYLYEAMMQFYILMTIHFKIYTQTTMCGIVALKITYWPICTY